MSTLLSLDHVTTYYAQMRILEAVANHPAVVEAYLGRDPEALAEA